MSGSNEDKANEWMAQAEKKLKSFSLFNSSGKYEEAAEMFVKAANLYKLAKKSNTSCNSFEITHFSTVEQAGGAFIKAAEAQLKLQSKHEAASNYVNAAMALKKSSAAGVFAFISFV